MGVSVSHPHAVHISVEGGVVTLSGAILKREGRELVREVKHMPGVRELVNRLEPHGTSDHVSALQGGNVRSRRAELLQDNWTPGVRLLVGVAGTLLTGLGLSGRRALIRPKFP